MALATRCPYCHTAFRVASDQLKLRGGIVRCGACQRIFDGNAHLVDLDAIAAAKKAETASTPTADAPPSLPAADAPPPPAPAALPAHDAGVDADDQTVYTLDFGHTLDPLGILPETGDVAMDPASAVDDVPPAPALDDGGADVSEAADIAGVTAAPTPPEPAPPAPETAAPALPAIDAESAVPDTRVPAAPTAAQHADAVSSGMPAHADDPAAQDGAPAHMRAHADSHAQADAPVPAGTHDADTDADAAVPPAPLPHAFESPPATSPEAPSDLAPAPDADTAAPPSSSPAGNGDLVATSPAMDPGAGAEHAAAPDTDANERSGVAAEPPSRIEPVFGLPVDEELVAQPLPDAGAYYGHGGRHAPPLDDVSGDASGDASGATTETPPARLADASANARAEPAESTESAEPTEPAEPAVSIALPLRASAAPDPDPAAPARLEPTLAGPKSAKVRSAEARARRSALTPTRIEAPRLRVPAATPADEPEFVKRSRRQERSGKTVGLLLALGAAILLLVLLAQLVLNFRNELAARHPGARPALGAACSLLGCRVEWPAHAENLVIDEGDLAPIGPDAYALNTALHNQGDLTQAWPSIELELVDAARKPVLRRVFGPADYLPAGARLDAGFGARSELPVKLNFTLAGVTPASYNIFVFYP